MQAVATITAGGSSRGIFMSFQSEPYGGEPERGHQPENEECGAEQAQDAEADRQPGEPTWQRLDAEGVYAGGEEEDAAADAQ